MSKKEVVAEEFKVTVVEVEKMVRQLLLDLDDNGGKELDPKHFVIRRMSPAAYLEALANRRIEIKIRLILAACNNYPQLSHLLQNHANFIYHRKRLEL